VASGGYKLRSQNPEIATPNSSQFNQVEGIPLYAQLVHGNAVFRETKRSLLGCYRIPFLTSGKVKKTLRGFNPSPVL
jgi:hypothetical protein